MPFVVFVLLAVLAVLVVLLLAYLIARRWLRRAASVAGNDPRLG